MVTMNHHCYSMLLPTEPLKCLSVTCLISNTSCCRIWAESQSPECKIYMFVPRLCCAEVKFSRGPPPIAQQLWHSPRWKCQRCGSTDAACPHSPDTDTADAHTEATGRDYRRVAWRAGVRPWSLTCLQTSQSTGYLLNHVYRGMHNQVSSISVQCLQL